MGLREERRRATRQRIQDTAYHLFGEHGFERTTVDAIASAAGVSPRTFFRYFETKDGVLSAVGFDLIDRTLEQVPSRPSVTELIHELAAVFETALAEEQLRQAVVLLRENPTLSDRAAFWRERWALQLAGGLAAAEGTPGPDLAQKVVASAAVCAVAVCVDEWLHISPHVRFTELAEIAARSLHGGSPC